MIMSDGEMAIEKIWDKYMFEVQYVKIPFFQSLLNGYSLSGIEIGRYHEGYSEI